MTSSKKNALFVLVALMTGSVPSLVLAADPIPNKTSLLSATELEGAALGADDLPDQMRARRVNTAMLESLKAQDQIRRVEMFLKSGAAQSGDLRVVQTGKPETPQK